MATIKLSTGSTFGTGFNSATARKLVQDGDATLTTAGVSGWDVVTSVSPTIDTKITSATALAPFLLGVDDIFFTPLQIPEPAAGL